MTQTGASGIDQYLPILTKLEQTLREKKNSTTLYREVCNLLHQSVPHYTWVGIYLVEGGRLRLKAYDGPAATEHTEIEIGRGICGAAAETGRTEIVSDVGKDPRYLQCFISTKCEIVVPIKDSTRIYGEIDIDSDELGAFTVRDKQFLELLCTKLLQVVRG